MIPFSEVQPVARRLFQTRDGEIVLTYLLDRYYHSRIKNETLTRQVGQRDVLLHIKQLLESVDGK